MNLTKEALLAAHPVFLHNFSSVEEVFKEFQVDGLRTYYYRDGEDEALEPQRLEALKKKYHILFADYTYEDYSGDVYVLGYDKETEQFFEVHGGHCSCYGIENQFLPEYCTVAELQELLMRRFAGYDAQRAKWSWNTLSADSSDELKMWIQMAEGKWTAV